MEIPIYLNGKEIMIPQPWSQVDFINHIHNAFDHKTIYVRTVSIGWVLGMWMSHPAAINEALDAIVECIDNDLGLSSLSLTMFRSNVVFDEHLLLRLAKKT